MLENGRGYMTWDPIVRKKRKPRPKTTWMDGIREMKEEMGLRRGLERDWENWWLKITGQI